jgi:hypothetical protein
MRKSSKWSDMYGRVPSRDKQRKIWQQHVLYHLSASADLGSSSQRRLLIMFEYAYSTGTSLALVGQIIVDRSMVQAFVGQNKDWILLG